MFPALYGGAQLFGGVISVIIYQVLKKSGYTCLVPSEFNGSNKIDPEASSVIHNEANEAERTDFGSRAVLEENNGNTNFGYVESET